jgi:hypothetical protein
MAATKKVGPATAYVADASPGEPVCVYGTGGSGEGLTVSLYFGRRGKLKGVVVFDMDTGEELGAHGKLPKDYQD